MSIHLLQCTAMLVSNSSTSWPPLATSLNRCGLIQQGSQTYYPFMLSVSTMLWPMTANWTMCFTYIMEGGIRTALPPLDPDYMAPMCPWPTMGFHQCCVRKRGPVLSTNAQGCYTCPTGAEHNHVSIGLTASAHSWPQSSTQLSGATCRYCCSGVYIWDKCCCAQRKNRVVARQPHCNRMWSSAQQGDVPTSICHTFCWCHVCQWSYVPCNHVQDYLLWYHWVYS